MALADLDWRLRETNSAVMPPKNSRVLRYVNTPIRTGMAKIGPVSCGGNCTSCHLWTYTYARQLATSAGLFNLSKINLLPVRPSFMDPNRFPFPAAVRRLRPRRRRCAANILAILTRLVQSSSVAHGGFIGRIIQTFANNCAGVAALVILCHVARRLIE